MKLKEIENFSDSSNDESEDDSTLESPDAIPQIGDDALFLVGRHSRFGRSIKINNRFIY